MGSGLILDSEAFLTSRLEKKQRERGWGGGRGVGGEEEEDGWVFKQWGIAQHVRLKKKKKEQLLFSVLIKRSCLQQKEDTDSRRRERTQRY